MKKLITSIFLAFIFISASAQSNDFGNVNVRIGGNINAGLTITNSQASLFGIPSSDLDSSGVLATTIPVSVDFGLHKLVSVGLGFTTGSWLTEDPNDTDITILKKKINQLKLGIKFYPISKDNFNLYLGYDLGIGGFERSQENNNTSTRTNDSWKGTSNNLNLGTNFYFGGGLGMYFQMGYTGYKFNIKEFNVKNNAQTINYMELYDYQANMVIKGVQLELGLAYTLGVL